MRHGYEAMERFDAFKATLPILSPMRRIVMEVAMESGVSVHDILGKSHEREISKARHKAMFRVRRETGRSYPAIGRFFNRHHSTVIDGERAHIKRINKGKPEGAKT